VSVLAALRGQAAGAARLQRACACAGKAPCDSCRKKKRPQRRASDALAPAQVDLRSLDQGGQQLPPRWRRHLEPLFGVDFGAVRIHDDAASHAASSALHANAFTLGQHVHFAAGRWAPASRDGLHLLAHELAHTIQQRSAAAAALLADTTDLDGADAPLERAADAHADAVVAGRSTRVAPGTALAAGPAARLQRDAADTVELDHDNGDGTGVRIRRWIEDRPCTPATRRVRPETITTPTDQIFRWDRQANAIALNYWLCSGSVRLDASHRIDYDRVLRAGERLLDTLRTNPAAGADLPTLARTAIDQAQLSMAGEVSITVDGILQARVGAESTLSTGEQQVRVTGRLQLTPQGWSFRLTGIVDAARSADRSTTQYQLNLRVGTRWFAVDAGVRREETSGPGAAGASTDRWEVGTEVRLPDVGPLQDAAIRLSTTITPRPGREPEVTPGLSLTIPFGGADRSPSVSCYRCECPPPIPRYRCEPYGKREVEDRPADDQRVTLLYQYNSDSPADAAEFGARAQSVADMAARGYAVQSIRGYASPEGAVPYNLGLSQRRADRAQGEIAQRLPAGAVTLPAAEGLGELNGASSSRPGAEAANAELTRELVARLQGLSEDERLELLGVDQAVRRDETRRRAALDDIQAFIDGRDARGRRLAGRARWERVFPFMRRVDVRLHLERLAHEERVPHPEQAGDCPEAERAYIDRERPIPASRRLPQETCER